MWIFDAPLWLLIAGVLLLLAAVGVPAGLLAARRHRSESRSIFVLVQVMAVQFAVWYAVAIVLEQASFHQRVRELEATQGPSVVLLDRSFGPFMLRRVVSWNLSRSGTGAIDFTWNPAGTALAAAVWTAASSVLMAATWWVRRPRGRSARNATE